MKRRVGECSRCGACCSLIGCWSLGRKEDGIDEYQRFHNIETIDQLTWLTHPCQHLKANRYGRLKCDIYHDRPGLCQAFPSEPNAFWKACKAKGCTFDFEEVD